MNVTRENRSYTYEYLAVFVYAIIVFITSWFHEPWRDEAQAWLLARDLSIPRLLHEMGYDGSPALWHLLLMPLAKLSMAAHINLYYSMNLLNGVFATAAVFLFMRYAPFDRIMKTAFIFSYFMIYEYSIIARSYALSIFLLFLLATIYQHRHQKPIIYAMLIAALVNTNTHSMFPVAALSIMFLYEMFQQRTVTYRNHLYSVFILAAGGILAFWQVLPPSDSWKPGLFNEFEIKAVFDAIGHAFIPLYTDNPANTLFMRTWPELIIFTVFLSGFLIFLFYDKKAWFFFIFSFAGLAYILIFKHSGYLRHYGMIMIWLMFSLWIYPKEFTLTYQKRTNEYFKTFKRLPILLYYGLLICLTISITDGLRSLKMDISQLFSGSAAMAREIKAIIPAGDSIAAYNIHTITAILPYTPEIHYWDPGINQRFTYIHWNNQYLPSRKLDQVEVVMRVIRKAGNLNKWYLLMPYAFDNPEPFGFHLVYSVKEGVTSDEKYYLYRYDKKNI